MEIENKQIEIEKTNILEAYAKSWGHYNDKQKIKYTGRLIKDIDSITQVINIIFNAKIMNQDNYLDWKRYLNWRLCLYMNIQ